MPEGERRRRPLRVGLIGLGAVGLNVWRLAASHPELEIVGALVRNVAATRDPLAPPTVGTLDGLLAMHPEIVAEVAGHAALAAHGPRVLQRGVPLITTSAGALADPELEARLLEAADRHGVAIRVAGGSIGALDALRAARIGGLDQVSHTIRKSPGALPSAEAGGGSGARVLFAGPVREGARLFPENVNVAAAVSLAGAGFDATTLTVIADPTVTRNCHEVTASGAFGSFRLTLENVPSAENPRTGRLVSMSVVAALLEVRSPLRVG